MEEMIAQEKNQNIIRLEDLRYVKSDGSIILDISAASTINGSLIEPSQVTDDRKNRYYVCHSEGCSRSFSYLYQLRKHLNIAHKTNYYDCPRCGLRFLKFHEFKKHAGNIYACERDSKSPEKFKTWSESNEILYAHRITIEIAEKFETNQLTCFSKDQINLRCPTFRTFSSLILY